MTLSDYLAQTLTQRLTDARCLVVYDGTRRYHDLVRGLASATVRVVDASTRYMEAREQAQRLLTQVLPHDDAPHLLLYLPYDRPTEPMARLRDPFLAFVLAGAVFPAGPTDRYNELCKACYPGQESRIDELFAHGEPDFATVDALGGGQVWALLQTVTGGQSDGEILQALLMTTDEAAWKAAKGVGAEWKTFARQTLGLKTAASALPTVRNELWRFLLFSEFAYDLPPTTPLPAELGTVPRGGETQRKLVLTVCDALRHRTGWEATYRQRAEDVDAELGLSDYFGREADLGDIITFAFEENTFLHRYLTATLQGNAEEAARHLRAAEDSPWQGGESGRAVYWHVARCGADLLQRAAVPPKPFRTLADLAEWYATEGYHLDAAQRTFETHVADLPDRIDSLDDFTARVRRAYREASEAVQKRYQALVREEGWPGSLALRNTQVFDRYVEPPLRTNVPTAYLWVDALRYELGQDVASQLRMAGLTVEVLASAAFVPTVTKLAMAALLPEADQKLSLVPVGEGLEAAWDEQVLKTLQDRVGVFRARLGDRFRHQTVDQFLDEPKPKPVDLLGLSFTEIDTAGEALASNALAAIRQAGQKLTKAVRKLQKVGYRQVVIATDHGFVLHPDFQPGDQLTKPSGEWLLSKSRCLAGKGSGDGCLVFAPEALSIRSEVPHFVFPRQFGVFARETRYFHEGLSVQENLVPVLLLTIGAAKAPARAEVTLSYKGKQTGRVTTRRPSIELAAFVSELFPETLTVRLEIRAGAQAVGVLVPQERVNPVAGTVELQTGESLRLTLALDDDFEGAFEVLATDPATGRAYATRLNLETEYL